MLSAPATCTALVALSLAAPWSDPGPSDPGPSDPGASDPATSDPAGAPPSRRLLFELASINRLAGTSGSQRGADWVARQLEEAGLEVELDEREVLLSLPRALELRLFADVLADEPFHERFAAFDPDRKPPGDVPPFSAWGKSGELRAAAIDAGYGSREEFERLRAAGVEPSGKVALIRYGRSYRGVKVEVAAEFGCAAVLLFSDPDDDGAGKGEVWPGGRWKPGWAAQRGAILAIARAPGDPSTPGFASPAPGEKPGLDRLEGAELEERLPPIPCMPIGAEDALQIVEKLRVRPVPTGTEGESERRPAGPGPVQVALRIDAPIEPRRIVNVIGRLRGAREQTVLLGNHRDAWVRGAHDAGTGTVALLRAAQILAARVREGWRPRHSIAFAFWDAEEFGLLGSTEWAEDHADWVRENLLAYVNGDAVVGGPRVRAGGSPGLEPALARAMARVASPAGLESMDEPGPDADAEPLSLADTWLDEEGAGGRLGLPGSGSDFTVFAHHLHVPVLDIAFGGSRGGQYHTAFDDFEFVERFIDPGFVVHEAAGALFAEIATEVAELGPLSFDEAWAARELARHARAAGDAIGSDAAERLGRAFEELEAAVRDTWIAWSDPGESGASVEASHGLRDARSPATPTDRARAVDELGLADLRRRLYPSLALESGLAGRPWYRNRLWSPSLATGYAAETFPGLRESAGEDARRAALEALLGALEARRATWHRRLAAPR